MEINHGRKKLPVMGILLSMLLCINFGGMALILGFWPLLVLIAISLVSGLAIYRGRKGVQRSTKRGPTDTG